MMGELPAISRLRKLGEELLELVFPPACALCERIGTELICTDCREQFQFIEPPYCQHCGRPLSESAQRAVVCGECRQNIPRFDAARAVGLHTQALREAVLKFKFGRRQRLVEPLAQLLAQRISAETSRPNGLAWSQLNGLVPVVLHPQRRGWRGFDQAILLSRRLSALTEIPCLENVLVRTKNTMPQIGLSPARRRQNVRGAFEVIDERVITGGSFLLIDDVYTTGSTMNAAAQVLRKSGAETIYALTLTRAVPTTHPQLGQRLGDEDDWPEGRSSA